VQSLSEFLSLASHRDEAERLGIGERLARARAELERVSGSAYLSELEGTIGADPIARELPDAVRARRGSQLQLSGVSSLSN
jgi:hypothetical protein